MKKAFSLILALSFILSALVGCTPTGQETPTDAPTDPIETPTDAPTNTPTEPVTEAPTDPETDPETEPATEPESGYPSVSEPPKSLKILAIGNSFSTDALEYFYQIAKSAGVETVILGNLYIGGCSLDTHYSHAKLNDKAYKYYKNTSGNWVTTSDATFEQGLTDEDWDFITFQQTSKTCGMPITYGALDDLIEIVKEKMTNKDAKLLWHMTWAYQQDSTHSSFPNYDNDQMKMYDMIISTIDKCILSNKDIDGVIPNGTSIQNARTSFTGDTLTRDGYHLNKTLGRYIAALTYYATITGADISGITYSPSADVKDEVMAMAKESVINAVKKPYEVTESTFKEGTWGSVGGDDWKDYVEGADCFEADLAIAAGVGVDLTKYKLFEFDYIENAYYNCKNGTSLTRPGSSAGTYKENVCTAEIYSKEQIPEGSIIICDAGWQFRPEVWVSLDKKNPNRPSISTANITVLNAAWWQNYNYMAINISSNPKSDISGFYPAAASHVRIYVPIVTG